MSIRKVRRDQYRGLRWQESQLTSLLPRSMLRLTKVFTTASVVCAAMVGRVIRRSKSSMVRAYASVILSASLTFSAVSFCQQPVRDGLTLPNIHAHDPWVLADQSTHTYYMYVGFYVNSSGIRRTGIETYKSKDLKSWSGPYEVFEVPKDSWANPAQGVWAPEVHLYKNHYYLFATLNNYDKPLAKEGDASKDTQINIVYHGGGQHLRGTQVFVSDTPEGPFKTIVDSPIAPSNLMTL